MKKLAYMFGAFIITGVLAFGSANADDGAVEFSADNLINSLMSADSSYATQVKCSTLTGKKCTGGEMKHPKKCTGGRGNTNRCVVCEAGEPNKWSGTKAGKDCKGAV